MKYYYLTYRITLNNVSYSYGGFTYANKFLDLKDAATWIAKDQNTSKSNVSITGIFPITRATFNAGL